ncbi:MAG: hypothetical protein VX589_07130 [Myxococcota bacterium]|nr:hypothetical protein [Myxococcota bacterium]
MKCWAYMVICSFTLAACSSVVDERAPTLHDEDRFGDPLTTVDKRRSVSCAGRWHVNAQSPNAQSIPYHRATRCSGRATLGARRFATFITTHFGQQLDQNRPNGPVEIYNCRPIRGGQAYSVHSEGRAIDIYIPKENGRANNRLGDQIANWIAANAAYVGIQYIIWDRTSWQGSRASQSRCYTGQHPHDDHIHVELTRAASRAETAFFQVITEGASRPDAPDHAPPPPTRVPMGRWLGEPCVRDTDCARLQTGQTSQCMPLLTGDHGSGICTISCEGFCPDRIGAAPTFCMHMDTIDPNLGGLCVARSHSTNQWCSVWDGFQSQNAQRYTGDGDAPPKQATVCVPANLGALTDVDEAYGDTQHVHDDAAAAPDEEESSPDAPPWRDDMDNEDVNDGADRSPRTPDEEVMADPSEDEADEAEAHRVHEAVPPSPSVCDDPGLTMSDNDQPCPNVAHNTWRCACSIRYEVSVSQVCRGGVWINYELHPSDCGQCDGHYTRGCAPH